MFIAFLGCDGSGKSAVIAGVSDRLLRAGVMVRRGHWRPRALVGARDVASSSADDPHGQVPRGLVGSLMKLGWLWLHWWVGWIRFLRIPARNGVVLFDRYHADLMIDPRRYRYGGPLMIARLASRLMPQPDLVIFLDAEPDVLLTRKQEIEKTALEQLRRAYLQWAQAHSHCCVIDASAPLERVVDDVMRVMESPSPESLSSNKKP